VIHAKPEPKYRPKPAQTPPGVGTRRNIGSVRGRTAPRHVHRLVRTLSERTGSRRRLRGLIRPLTGSFAR
jgi:hypothetical protein